MGPLAGSEAPLPPRFLAHWTDGDVIEVGDAAALCIDLRGLRDIAEHYSDEVVTGAVNAVAAVVRPLHRERDLVARLDEGCLLVLMHDLTPPEALYLAVRTVERLRDITVPGATLADLPAVAVLQMTNGRALDIARLREEVTGVTGKERVRMVLSQPIVKPVQEWTTSAAPAVVPAFATLPEPRPATDAPVRVSAFR